MKKKIFIIVIIVLLAIIGRYLYSIFGTYMKMQVVKKRPAPAVVVETIKDENVIQNFEAPGRVVSKYQVSIMARISGYFFRTEKVIKFKKFL